MSNLQGISTPDRVQQTVRSLYDTILNSDAPQSSKNDAMEQLEKLGESERTQFIPAIRLPDSPGSSPTPYASKSDIFSPYKNALKDKSASKLAKDHARRVLITNGFDRHHLEELA